MDYQETEKMQEFVGRLQDATDLIEKINPEPPIPWKKSQLRLWGMLDDLGTAMMNEVKWDPKFMAEQEAIEF
jgi:hypothetical protein